MKFSKLFICLVCLIGLGLNSCIFTLIGYGLGSSIDYSEKTFTDSELYSLYLLNDSDTILVYGYRKNVSASDAMNVIEGPFKGIKFIKDPHYQHNFNRERMRNAPNYKIPELYTTIIFRHNFGRPDTLVFMGLAEEFIVANKKSRDAESSMLIKYSSLKKIEDKYGREFDVGCIEHLCRKGLLPSLPNASAELQIGADKIQLGSVEELALKNYSDDYAKNGALIGAGVDLLILSAVAIVSTIEVEVGGWQQY